LKQQALGKVVAIHVDSEDYAVGETNRKAVDELLSRHQADGRIVTLRIGPPPDSDIRLAMEVTL